METEKRTETDSTRGNVSSRTAKSFKNVVVAAIVMVVNLLLQFYTRDIFLIRLGTEVLGLNTTATSLLKFLNLAELGIGTAVAFSLYKPLFDGDRKRICEIVTLQGHLYKRIACVIIAGAVILGCFFPWIFADMQLPLWYAYASFGVIMIGSLLTYFVNYKEILLAADQKEYKIMYSYRLVMMSRLVAQGICVWYLDNPYIWWLAIEGGFAILASVSLSWMIRRTYPYLRSTPDTVAQLRRRYPTIVTKIKQVFFHKVSTYVLQYTSPLVIMAFGTLTLVAYYGNYMMIVTGIGLLLNALFNGINAGVGNLVAEGRKSHMLEVFGELFAVRFLICMTCSVCMLALANLFVTVWIGAEYLLPMSTVTIISVTLFINVNRASVDSFIAAYGLYQDIWAPVTEAVLNLGLSILFGWLWGLNGILCGVLASLMLLVFIWKPYFLFRCGFRTGIGIYVSLYLRSLLAAAAAGAVLWLLFPFLPQAPGYAGFMLTALCVLLLYGGSLAMLMWFVTPEIRHFAMRLKSIINRKK